MEVAGGEVAGRHFLHFRNLLSADIHRVLAPRIEFAAFRGVHHVADQTLNRREVFRLRIEARNGIQQSDRIRVLRVLENFILLAEQELIQVEPVGIAQWFSLD